MSIPLSGRLPSDIKKAYVEYEKKHEQYVKDIEAYNEAAKKWNAGSRTSPFNVPEPVAPTFGYTDEQVQAAVTRDQQLRQSAVGVAFNPAAYNLSGFGFTPFGPNVATSMGRPKGATVTETGIGSLMEDKPIIPAGPLAVLQNNPLLGLINQKFSLEQSGGDPNQIAALQQQINDQIQSNLKNMQAQGLPMPNYNPPM